MNDASTIRPIGLTRAQRGTLRRLIRDEARRQGYGRTYHDDRQYPGGPHDWPDPLRRLAAIWRRLIDNNTLVTGTTSFEDVP